MLIWGLEWRHQSWVKRVVSLLIDTFICHVSCEQKRAPSAVDVCHAFVFSVLAGAACWQSTAASPRNLLLGKERATQCPQPPVMGPPCDVSAPTLPCRAFPTSQPSFSSFLSCPTSPGPFFTFLVSYGTILAHQGKSQF